MKNNRLHFLDSLRGFASIFVILSHFSEAYNIGNTPKFAWIKYSPLHFFYNAPAAVSLFFVLSGYVIALYLDRIGKLDLLSFYKKRIFRIWPAFVAAFIISYILFLNFTPLQTSPMGTEWINTFWRHPMSAQHLLKQLLLFDVGKDVLVPQAWTLRVIFQFSFLMPFLYVIYKKMGALGLLMANLVLYFLFSGSYFIIHFSLGMFIAIGQQEKLNYFASLKNRYNLLIILALIGMFTFRFTIPFYYKFLTGSEFPFMGNGGGIRVISGFGAFLILVYCLSSVPIQKALDYKPLVALGRLSYCMYLTHFMLLLYVVPKYIYLLNSAGIYNRYVVMLSAAIVLVLLTIIVSYLLRIFVEKPFSKLGDTLFEKKKKQTEPLTQEQPEEVAVLT